VRGIGFVVYPGFSVMVLTIVNVFEIANTVAGSPPYELHFLSEKGGKIKTSSGMMLDSEAFTDMPFDTLIVSAARFPKPSTPGMIAFLRQRQSGIVVSPPFVQERFSSQRPVCWMAGKPLRTGCTRRNCGTYFRR